MSPWLTVVGIGEDGWRGLSRHARQALLAADTIFGGARHLALLPARIGGERRAWPTPFTIAPVLEYRQRTQAGVCARKRRPDDVRRRHDIRPRTGSR